MEATWSDNRFGGAKGRLSGGFLTPQPPAWKKAHSAMEVLPMSERKRTSPASFHVIHKIPASDSPYGKAKHVQLVDKDPSKAISLFWAAINAGDRVDSALKDMAVVMKQLNRSDEAIEAIKSFRHLCPYESQESLDNVLVELYKRSGRIDEEIEILQKKLRNIEEGTVFGGKRTKIARSQGKKVQITIEQEKSRILGNLAWAYLQQHNYGIAEQHYRKALSLEPDRNKHCNLAICLMHMNRINEAKSLLQDVKASCGDKQMDESYSKSYERAFEMLVQAESRSVLEPVAKEPDKGRETQRSLTSCRDRSLKEASIYLPRNEDNFPGLPYPHWEGKMQLSTEQNGEYGERSSQCTPIGGGKGNLQSSSQTIFTEKWRKGLWFESPSEGTVCSEHKKIYAASRKKPEVLLTQPRRTSWGFNNTADQRRGGRWGEEEDHTVRNSIRKLSFEQFETSQEEEEILFTQPRNSSLWINNKDQRRGRWTTAEHSLMASHTAEDVDESETEQEKAVNTPKKSWADMVEEEEEEEEFNDENLNSNIIYHHHQHFDSSKDLVDNVARQLESLDMKSGQNTPVDTVSTRRNRLQVFRDITSP